MAVFRFLPLLCYAGLAAKAVSGLVWPECRDPFHKGRTGGTSMGYGLPRTGSLGEQQVVMEVQGAGDRQELAWGLGRDRAEAGLGLGSRILSVTAEGSPK